MNVHKTFRRHPGRLLNVLCTFSYVLCLQECFNIAFMQLRVIPITKNMFVEILAAAECHLITNHVKNIKEAAIPNMSSCKIS